ncbi:uncharacterized protein LOC109845347 isoform X3 [Asparagus officinalis]|uniref:uncharacterized protein LOC109845347 isoform X3 n=1 Tax=Asparagus officinalis TaxID=4686 RepID=UPI00098E1DFF|nr:uncharacterized protein LOC109845347 isoform X3 [Asparagus officinalis]XP_020270183.1 uncharacterized protein LOC109845347 isoform X3 [Asparagus officinalis]
MILLFMKLNWGLHLKLMLLHDLRNEDGIKSFFQEVHELYIKDQRRLGAIILPTQDEVVALAKKLSILNGDAAELSKEKILNLLYDELRRWTIDCSFQIGPVLIVDEPFTVEVVFLVHDNESHDLSSELTRRWILGKKEESLVLGSERERVSEKKKKGEGFIDDHHLGAITKIVLQEQLS